MADRSGIAMQTLRSAGPVLAFLLVLVISASGSAGSPPALTAAELRYFESKVRPLLIEHCYACHSTQADRSRGGLTVDSRDALRRGGASGPAVVPGDVEGSLLVQAIRHRDEDLAMPPKGKLPDEAIRVLEEWIAMGAPDPRDEEIAAAPIGQLDADRTLDLESARNFWSFLPARLPDVPDVAATDWPHSPIDRFLLAAMEAEGIAPVGDADRRTWLRRVTFDLTGLPPTPEEALAFERDGAAGAKERVVDRLLASSAFGERWGRHWLDVARYAESSGKENNVLYPHAWRYRDYVVAAFNADKPYDLFLREQVAGDLLPAEDADDRAENLVATAYLALGPKSHNAQNRAQFAYDLVDEQIDALTQGLIGLTVACARCHDHKFDPIPQSDYYAMAGIFLSSSTRFGTVQGPGNRHASGLISLPDDATVAEGPHMPAPRRSILLAAKDRFDAQVDRGRDESGDAVDRARMRQIEAQRRTIESVLLRFDESGRPTADNRVSMGVVEGQRIIDAPVMQRGEIDKPGERVARGFVQVVAGADTPAIGPGSGRLALADWIADPNHPLTARVWVNRVWLHIFGKGIVPTPDNFGMSGSPPTHPELLDWLAVRLVELEWSSKALIRELVLSRAYGMASTGDAENHAKDPDNLLLWRMPVRRLEAEAIRDAMLAVAGTLRSDGAGSSPINLAEGVVRGNNRVVQASLERREPVRSIYLPIVRDRLPEALEAFDFADPSFVTGARAATNVATQALFLMNDEEAIAAAEAFAARVAESASSERERLILAFERALGRRPTSEELALCRGFLRDALATENSSAPPSRRRGRNAAQQDPARAERAAWALFCQSLFQTAEFRTLH